MESTVSEAALQARVARLERAARRERIVALGVLALALATAQAPAPTSSPVIVRDAHGSATLTARGLTIRDASNTTRILVGLDDHGYPSVDLSDTGGSLREAMDVISDHPVLRQYDKAGKRRAELFLASDTDNGEFVIRDTSETNRAALFIGTKGLPEIAFYGSDAKARAYLSADDIGAYLVMNDRSAVSRVVMGNYTDGHVGMDIRDAAGNALWKAP
jgi:hypothetical protein